MLHARASTYYDVRALFLCEEGACELERTAREGTSFQERYAESYVAQMAAFAARVERGVVEPNVPLQHALFLERLVEAWRADG